MLYAISNEFLSIWGTTPAQYQVLSAIEQKGAFCSEHSGQLLFQFLIGSDYKKAHLERNQRNVQRGFNHPSIIFWSLYYLNLRIIFETFVIHLNDFTTACIISIKIFKLN